MNILYLMPYFPFPPNTGGKAVSYRNIELLSEKHIVDLCCFAWNKTDWKYIELCKKYCRQLIMIDLRRKPLIPHFFFHNLAGHPYSIYRNISSTMRKAVSRLTSTYQYDVVFVDTIVMMPYLPNDNNVKTILETPNAESEIVGRFTATLRNPLLRLLGMWEARNLKRFEVNSCLSVNKVLTLSKRDKNHLVDWGVPTKQILVGPTYVDDPLPTISYGVGMDIVHIGTAHWPPNVDGIQWFVKYIFPLVKRNLSEARFLIIGKEPPRNITQLHNDKDIFVLGFVEDIEDIYAKTGVFIVPLRIGSGIRIKIINAMARGLPVVSTSVGCEGMDVVNGKHLLIADKAEDFADAVISLLKSKDLRISLGKAAHAFYLQKFTRFRRINYLDGVLNIRTDN